MNDEDPKLTGWKLRYRWITWAGIALNLTVALPLVFFPHAILSLVRIDSDPVTWAQFFGVLLTILSVFYIPAASDVDKYRWYAWAAAGSRLAGVIFATYAVVFLDANDGFLLAVLIDGTIGLLQTIALVKVSQLEQGWNRKSRIGMALLLLLAAVSVPAIVGWHKFLHELPQQIVAAPSGDLMIERFNHASIGTEKQNGIPY